MNSAVNVKSAAAAEGRFPLLKLMHPVSAILIPGFRLPTPGAGRLRVSSGYSSTARAKREMVSRTRSMISSSITPFFVSAKAMNL